MSLNVSRKSSFSNSIIFIVGDIKDIVYSSLGALRLKLADREKLQGQSDQQYKTIYKNTLLGTIDHPKAYEEAYNDLPDNEKNKKTLPEYSYDRYFREKYLPSIGFTYGAVSEGPKENSFVTAARYTINILKANDPDDPNIEIIKADLKERLGTNDLSPYGL